MRTLEVLDGGLFTTVQDLGRVNYQRYGVAVSGAMDPFALRAANRLAGNADNAAGLEITMFGPEIRFGHPATIAIAGADLGPLVDGKPVGGWRSVSVRAGSTLSFSGARDGMRAYVAIDGGIDVPVVLGSRSTSTRSSLGGFEGRALRAGDVISVGEPESAVANRRRALERSAIPTYGHEHVVRVVLGPQDDGFTEDALATFRSAVYTVTPQSDRIGSRLQGPALAHRATADIVSDGTTMGSVQVSGDGMPIVLMADRGTTGGYTKIATVISVDLSKLAQAAPGDRVRFVTVTLDEAHECLRAEMGVLDSIGVDPIRRLSDPDVEIFDEDAGSELAAPAWDELADALENTGWREKHDDDR